LPSVNKSNTFAITSIFYTYDSQLTTYNLQLVNYNLQLTTQFERMMDDYESHLRPNFGVFPLSELAERSAKTYGDKIAMRAWAGDHYREISYTRLCDWVNAIARWLIERGIAAGDRVAVLGENRPEWGAAYLGIQAAGAIVVPVDSLMPSAGIRHILVDSGTRILFATNRFLKDVSEMADIHELECKVCISEETFEDAIPLSQVIEEGSKLIHTLPQRTLDELAAILYTSGTTGHSKGVMLSQKNIASNIAAASRLFPLNPEDNFLSVLPIHHAFECTTGFLLPLYCGCAITYARSLKSADIMADIRNTGVTMMVGVPLLYEKMHDGIIRNIRKKGWTTQKLFALLYTTARLGKKFGFDLGVALFRDLREKAGLTKLKFFISGGGPLDPVIANFFNRLGIKLLQGYGLTETSPVSHVNPPWRPRNETVGAPIPGVQHKIVGANELGIGEVYIKGDNVFVGYYKNEEASREVLDEDGWFKTGDLGVVFPDNYLQIMGRKKNIIVTGGGKNVYPEEIEHYLNHSRFIAESLIMGIPRESGYGEEVGALIYPDYEQIDLYYEELGQGTKPTPKDVYNLVKAEIDAAQQNLADYKRIRRFRIHDEEFQKTSTRKIKRFLYEGAMFDTDAGNHR